MSLFWIGFIIGVVVGAVVFTIIILYKEFRTWQ